MPSRIARSASCSHLLDELVRQEPAPAQVPFVAANALAALLLFDATEVGVGRRVVGRSVRGHRYVTASMKVGPSPALARSTASAVAS